MKKEIWDTISLLMNRSVWGKISNSDSLIHDLKNEIEELYEACLNNDIENACEEAADIIMLVYCILYYVSGDDTFNTDELSERIIKKLYRRYGPILDGEINGDLAEEKKMWKTAKKDEHKAGLYFCNKEDCPKRYVLDPDNIKKSGGKLYCRTCESRLTSVDNSMYPNCKNADKYLEAVVDSIIDFAKGEYAEPFHFEFENVGAYKAFINNVLPSEDRVKVLLLNMSDRYGIDASIVEKYINEISQLSESERSIKSMEQDDLLRRYKESLQMKRSFNSESVRKEWENLYSRLRRMRFDIKEVFEKPVSFYARSWDNQVADKYILYYPSLSDGRLLECMSLSHFKKNRLIDFTVEISSMYGCTVGCEFCASGALTESPLGLEAFDYLKQVNTCVMENGINPAELDKFYVSFAGIGEPTCCYEEVMYGMRCIQDIYPNVRFNIATMGYIEEGIGVWNQANLPIRTLQLPLYHTESTKLKKIVKNLPKDYSLLRVLDEAMEYRKSHPECRVKINYIPFKGINDSDADVKTFADYLEHYKEEVVIKVSVLNYTKPAYENGYIGVEINRLFEICDLFKLRGFESYVFGSEKNTMLGCGQLVQNHISDNEILSGNLNINNG